MRKGTGTRELPVCFEMDQHKKTISVMGWTSTGKVLVWWWNGTGNFQYSGVCMCPEDQRCDNLFFREGQYIPDMDAGVEGELTDG